jgi:hypothetical protein
VAKDETTIQKARRQKREQLEGTGTSFAAAMRKALNLEGAAQRRNTVRIDLEGEQETEAGERAKAVKKDKFADGGPRSKEFIAALISYNQQISGQTSGGVPVGTVQGIIAAASDLEARGGRSGGSPGQPKTSPQDGPEDLPDRAFTGPSDPKDHIVRKDASPVEALVAKSVAVFPSNPMAALSHANEILLKTFVEVEDRDPTAEDADYWRAQKDILFALRDRLREMSGE